MLGCDAEYDTGEFVPLRKWWRVVLDEAQNVSNGYSDTAYMVAELAANARWCVSGTPVNNSLDDLHGLFCFLEAGTSDALFSDKDTLHREVLAEWQRLGSDPCAKQQLIGSTGSRLLSGNTAEHERLEAWLAAFHGHEAALLFNSGYDANLALLACVPAPGDAVLYDEARVPRVLSRPSPLS